MRILTVTLLLYVAFKTIPTHGQARIDRFSQILSREVEDSLRIQLTISKEDTNKVLIFHNLYYTILFSQPDSAMYLAQEGFRLAQRINFLKGQALCKADIGAVWWIIGEYSKANEMLLESLKIAEGIKDSVAIEWALAFLLSNSRDQGNYNEALKYAHRGAAIHKYFNDRVWNVILGSVYQEANKPDSALYYLQRGDMQDFNFLNLAHTYAKMGENDLASMFYKKTVSELTKHNNLKDLADAYIGLARLYEKKNTPDSAIFYAEKGFTIAQSSSFKKWVYETSLILSRVYEKKDAGKALYYHKLAMSAKDSMFNLQNITESLNARFNEQLNQQQAQTEKITYRNKIRTYVFSVCLGFLLLLAIILWRNNRHKQRDKAKIEKAYTELKATQAQLIQSEKMASLGELTAGIAHEIQNPLNFVNNFSEVNKELIEELKIKNEKLKIEDDEVNELLDDITQNLEKINQHGKRADAIVKGMLQHSRTSSGQKEKTDINALTDEYLRLAYHGLRAKDKNFNVTVQTDFDESIVKINIVPQEIGRVLLNLINNAFYAVSEKQKTESLGYEPTVNVSTRKLQDKIQISVKDNGSGIPGSIKEKIFHPFFTTKPTGQGTGLGLSLAYDIIKAHMGEIKVETKESKGSEFIILLPVYL